jgi:hypothetical protein
MTMELNGKCPLSAQTPSEAQNPLIYAEPMQKTRQSQLLEECYPSQSGLLEPAPRNLGSTKRVVDAQTAMMMTPGGNIEF